MSENKELKKEEKQELTLDKAETYFIKEMGIPPHDLKIIKDQIAPGISNGDLAYCLKYAQAYKLDPIKKELYFVPDVQTLERIKTAMNHGSQSMNLWSEEMELGF